MTMARTRTKNICLCALFTALITVGAFIKIPLPPVPFTLQVEFVFLAGLILGAFWGSLSLWIYVFMGLIGLPVFTQGGGLAYVFNPSFGYLIGFGISAFVMGWFVERKREPSYLRLLIACFIGLAISYASGMIYYYLISTLYLGKSVEIWWLIWNFFLIIIPKDIILSFLVAFIAKRVKPVINKM